MQTTQDILKTCNLQALGTFTQAAPEATTRDAALYLAHTGRGATIRALAAATGSHPSTVLRAVRRVEARRDDPLYERLIAKLEAQGPVSAPAEPSSDTPQSALELPAAEPKKPEMSGTAGAQAGPSEATVRKVARSALRRLSEPGAFLMMAPGSEKGGIFCAANGHRKPISMVDTGVAIDLLRRGWIEIQRKGAASIRYRITDAGRAGLKRLLCEDRASEGGSGSGFSEAQTAFSSPFAAQHALPGERTMADPESGAPAKIAVNLGESPLGWLSRRKGADGRPLLSAAEVEAGERLREDFEAAQMGPSVAQDWSRFLTPGGRRARGPGAGPAEGPRAARERAGAALAALGPGLADVAVRVCCFLEGLETCERRMGWSARSGKVVLKIALQRLVEHYGLAVFRH